MGVKSVAKKVGKGVKFVYFDAPIKSAKHTAGVVIGGGGMSRKKHLINALKYGAIASAGDATLSVAKDAIVGEDYRGENKMGDIDLYETEYPGIYVTEDGYFVDEYGDVYDEDGDLIEEEALIINEGLKQDFRDSGLGTHIGYGLSTGAGSTAGGLIGAIGGPRGAAIGTLAGGLAGTAAYARHNIKKNRRLRAQGRL